MENAVWSTPTQQSFPSSSSPSPQSPTALAQAVRNPPNPFLRMVTDSTVTTTNGGGEKNTIHNNKTKDRSLLRDRYLRNQPQFRVSTTLAKKSTATMKRRTPAMPNRWRRSASAGQFPGTTNTAVAYKKKKKSQGNDSSSHDNDSFNRPINTIPGTAIGPQDHEKQLRYNDSCRGDNNNNNNDHHHHNNDECSMDDPNNTAAAAPPSSLQQNSTSTCAVDTVDLGKFTIASRNNNSNNNNNSMRSSGSRRSSSRLRRSQSAQDSLHKGRSFAQQRVGASQRITAPRISREEMDELRGKITDIDEKVSYYKTDSSNSSQRRRTCSMDSLAVRGVVDDNRHVSTGMSRQILPSRTESTDDDSEQQDFEVYPMPLQEERHPGSSIKSDNRSSGSSSRGYSTRSNTSKSSQGALRKTSKNTRRRSVARTKGLCQTEHPIDSTHTAKTTMSLSSNEDRDCHGPEMTKRTSRRMSTRGNSTSQRDGFMFLESVLSSQSLSKMQ